MNRRLIILLILSLVLSCKDNIEKEPEKYNIEKDFKEISLSKTKPIKNIVSKNEDNKNIKVIVIPCSNGYEYANHGYSFNPLLKKELNKIKNIDVYPFPLKKLIGVVYQGVFHKRYCKPIIERVDADFLIMTKFTGNPFSENPKNRNWGYQTRVLNTTTMEQKNSIKATNLKVYSEIEAHIKLNINKIKRDIESMK